MKLRLVSKQPAAAQTMRFTFKAADGGPLPAFEPGAHVEFAFNGKTRRYSLTSSIEDLSSYAICVLRTTPGGGGSAFLHDRLAPGDVIDATGPHNGFPLRLEARHTVFIAGGIGITPFFSMMEALARAGRSFELHYAARSSDHFLQVPSLTNEIALYPDVDGRPTLDVQQLLTDRDPPSDIYVCGPRPLIEAVRMAARELDWDAKRVNFESFGAIVRPEDRPVQVNLVQTGISFTVDPGTTILEALLDHGVWAPYECRRGECASCLTEVTAGEPDHRDYCLTVDQRQGGICTCISWAKSEALTLNL